MVQLEHHINGFIQHMLFCLLFFSFSIMNLSFACHSVFIAVPPLYNYTTRVRSWALGSENMESYPLNRQGIPGILLLIILPLPHNLAESFYLYVILHEDFQDGWLQATDWKATAPWHGHSWLNTVLISCSHTARNSTLTLLHSEKNHLAFLSLQ